VETEYRAGVKKAMESKDAYQLALMALAANNMNDRESYLRLMNLMADQPEKGKVETSVVNSRDASLRVETWSLQALALLRANQPDMGRVANLLSKILGEKSYYGYGSTQATVLALKAITAYGRLAGKVAGETEIDFTLNNVRVTSYDSLNSLLQTGNNSFNVRYSKNENAVPYNLEVSYSTFIPPSADKAEIRLSTRLKSDSASAGETVRMDIEVSNTKSALQPMVIAKIGIPAGLSLQPWQLKEFTEKNKCAYYEIFDNYLVFYWMGFAPNETKTLGLDLKAEIPGTYKAKASTVYLYYTPEYKYWAEGTEVTVGSR
jgi:alpha-2-macroglobulin-like protein